MNGVLNAASAINDPNKKSDTIVYIDNISSKYINSDIKVNGAVKFDDPTDLNINVSSLPIANFSGGLARGSLNLDVKVFGKMLNDINTRVNGIINNFSYNLNQRCAGRLCALGTPYVAATFLRGIYKGTILYYNGSTVTCCPGQVSDSCERLNVTKAMCGSFTIQPPSLGPSLG